MAGIAHLEDMLRRLSPAKPWTASLLSKGGLQSPNRACKRCKASPCSRCQWPTQQHCPKLQPKAHMSAVQIWHCLLVLHCCRTGSGARNRLHGLPSQHCHPVWQSCMSRNCCWDDHTASEACWSSICHTSPASHMRTDAMLSWGVKTSRCFHVTQCHHLTMPIHTLQLIVDRNMFVPPFMRDQGCASGSAFT